MWHLMGVVILGLTLGQPAQPALIDGAWTVTVAAARDAADSGRTRSRNALSVSMQLTVKGEDVTGTWKTNLDGPWSITGTWKSGRLDVVSNTRDVPGTANGKKVAVAAHWVIRGALKGDTLGGTCSFIFGKDGDDPLWSSWTAARSR